MTLDIFSNGLAINHTQHNTRNNKMKTIQEIKTEINNLENRLDNIYESLKYELRFEGFNRNHCYIRSLEDKLTFGEFRLDDLREELKKAIKEQ